MKNLTINKHQAKRIAKLWVLINGLQHDESNGWDEETTNLTEEDHRMVVNETHNFVLRQIQRYGFPHSVTRFGVYDQIVDFVKGQDEEK